MTGSGLGDWFNGQISGRVGGLIDGQTGGQTGSLLVLGVGSWRRCLPILGIR